MIYKANVDFIWPIFVLIKIYMSGIRYNHNKCWYSLIINIHVEKIHKCFLACALHIVRPSNEGAAKMQTFSSFTTLGGTYILITPSSLGLTFHEIHLWSLELHDDLHWWAGHIESHGQNQGHIGKIINLYFNYYR